jgi:myo-inositol-1(or 4)-monophosphatase
MLGSSAIDLAWTAEGRLDACIMLGNKPWDTSAGVLIAREAGARVLDHDGSEHSHQSRSTIAVTPTLEAELMAAVHEALAE